MEDFIILRRIGKNSKKYLIEILDLESRTSRIHQYDRISESFELEVPITEDRIRLFSEYNSDNKLITIPETKTFNLDNFQIHMFDQEPTRLRRIKYTIRDLKSNIMFTPCCGKHVNHEEFRGWGHYANDIHLDFFKELEGYQIFDPDRFDMYLLEKSPVNYHVDLTQNRDFLLRELASYIRDLELTTSEPVEIKIIHRSGREISVKIV